MGRRRRLTFDEIVIRMNKVQQAQLSGGTEEAKRVWRELKLPSVETLIEDLAHSEDPDDE